MLAINYAFELAKPAKQKGKALLIAFPFCNFWPTTPYQGQHNVCASYA
ncbi:hypothetical protein DSBG_1910 [Desulfosporosinus sp. BG]|nr:hypothetical protein DSBG_1910 [Desulfosporosinus sp. BG]